MRTPMDVVRYLVPTVALSLYAALMLSVLGGS